MATTKDASAVREQGDKSAVKASDLAAATAKDGVLFDVRDLEVYFPIQQGFFKSMVSN